MYSVFFLFHINRIKYSIFFPANMHGIKFCLLHCFFVKKIHGTVFNAKLSRQRKYDLFSLLNYLISFVSTVSESVGIFYS